MPVLDRYIIRTVLLSVALVLGVLLTLAGLFLFIAQQDDIGQGNFTGFRALWFVALSLPAQFFDFLPVAALIGALMGLGGLARTSELTVMRAAGVSVWRIAVSVAGAGIVLMALSMLAGEFLAPTLGQIAREQKAFAQFSNVSFAGRGGAWVRDGSLIVKAEQQTEGGDFSGITVFDVAPDHSLVAVGRAASARALPEGGWQLTDYAESRFEGDRVLPRSDARRALASTVSAEFLGIAASDPMQLGVRTLSSITQYLRATGQDVRDYQFALWARVARTVAVVFAVLLALPFAFGSLRSSGAGARTTLGLVLGTGMFLLQRMVESGTVAFNLDPVLLAWLPTMLIAVSAMVLLARVR